MEKDLGTSSTKSDIVISIKEADVEEEEDVGGMDSTVSKLGNVGQWSSRFDCYKAYACSLPSYESLEMNWQVLNAYGLLSFVPFILFRIMVGIPVVIIQIMLGRYIMTNLSKSWSMHVVAKGVLYCEMVVTGCFIVQSLAITSYLLEYMMLSFTMPWRSCNETWASISCYEIHNFEKFFAVCLEHNSKQFCDSLKWKLSGMEYWEYVASTPNDLMSLFFNVLNSLLTTVVLFALVVKGVQSAEKYFGFFVYSSFILGLLMAFIICLTPEFVAGFKPFLQFDTSKILDLKMWVMAYDTTVFTLGIGRLPTAFISSLTNFKNNIFNDVLVVCFIDIFFCLVITLPPLCVMQIMQSREYNVPLTDSLDFFVSLSEMVLLFPFFKNMWSTLYYLLLALITVSSLIISTLALVQTITGFSPERFTSFYTSLVICAFSFFCSVIFFFYDFGFSVYFDRSVICILFLYLLTLEIFYGFQMFNDDFHFMMGYPVPFFLKVAWVLSLPISFVMIILNAINYGGDRPEAVHTVFSGIPFLIYLSTACFRIGIDVYQTKDVRKMLQLCKPDPDWGPADPNFKKSRILFDSRAVTKEFMYRRELREKLFDKPPDISEQSIVHVV